MFRVKLSKPGSLCEKLIPEKFRSGPCTVTGLFSSTVTMVRVDIASLLCPTDVLHKFSAHKHQTGAAGKRPAQYCSGLRPALVLNLPSHLDFESWAFNSGMMFE